MRVLDELTVRCVGSDGAQWHPWHPSNRGDISQHLVITARSRSFLYHQVRLMVGALKAVGSGELQVKQLRSILEACNITCLRARMAPAEGLYLVQVHYPSASVEGPGPPRQPSSSAGDAPGQS